MNRDVRISLKHVFCFLFSLCILQISTSSFALPFNIVPKAGTTLPTQIRPGQKINAYYTVTNNTLAQRNNNFVKYLPPNVSQVTSGGTYGDTCGAVFNLSGKGIPGDSCTLQLTISGVINSNDPNPHHHLFVCFPGGVTCAGTQFPLNITQNHTTLNNAYITNFYNYTVANCPIQNDGSFATCSIAYTALAPLTAIAINRAGSFVYIADQSNSVSSCPVNMDGSFGNCISNSIPTPSGIAINPAGTYAYITLVSLDLVANCPINSDGSFNIVSCGVTPGFNTPLAIAINPPGSFAYIVNASFNTISSCTVNNDGSLSNCVSNLAPSFPYAVAINPANTYVYITTSTDVFYCSINNDGTYNSCNNTGVNTFNFPTAITINAVGTIAYITNLNGNTVSSCPINIDGTFGNCTDLSGLFDGPDGISLLNT